ncbi:hypothetical protein AK88_00706 [Plasmodium fragile]|uniref:Uncharacterized protein n=1 Tax=Plasmodium fragile TaxID=5857 RepID=A0A0D9QRR8_PLAFR|nr:uncharacterized protein AK88_00706 [Plasmodium fragile]KJP89497.1 hypothetical protein AK88_00706 [Plasmodium fragile]
MKYNIRKNLIIKCVALIFFIWIYHKYNDEASVNKGLKHIPNGRNSLCIPEYRSLAEKEKRTGLFDTEQQDFLLKHMDKGMSKYGSYDSIFVDELPENSINSEIHKKQFTHKYVKGKRFRKLYAFFEEICDMIDRINENEEDSKDYLIRIIRSTVRKWGTRKVATVCSIPLIVILPIIIITGVLSELSAGFFILYGIAFTFMSYVFIFSMAVTIISLVKSLQIIRQHRRTKF